jgi:hypothetical protein
MVLDHERLDVYAVALEFLVLANEVIERLPRGRGAQQIAATLSYVPVPVPVPDLVLQVPYRDRP